jgi:hypothetical protein
VAGQETYAERHQQEDLGGGCAKDNVLKGKSCSRNGKSLAREEGAPGFKLDRQLGGGGVVDPYRATLGGGVRRSMTKDIG